MISPPGLQRQSSSLSSRRSSASEEKMSILSGGEFISPTPSRSLRGRKTRRQPRTHRGVWANAQFQYYLGKMDNAGHHATSVDMSDWSVRGYKSARHMRPQRSAEPHHEVLTSLQLFSADEITLNQAYEMRFTLLRLDAHKCGMTEIPEELPTRLPKLERLNVSCNCLTEASFPSSMCFCENLVELNVNNNVIESLPKALLTLPKLKRLYIGYNDLSSVAKIEQLTGLRTLDLECNNLSTFPWHDVATKCRGLVVLSLQNNQISNMDKSVRFFREMVQLNISHNMLKALPAEVFQMHKLKNLDASHNEIVRLPQINLTQSLPNMMDLLDLSYNKIYKFSDWLFYVSWLIDMTANKISTMTGNVTKHMVYSTHQQLRLRDNPMSLPPYDVCIAGLPAIIKYFQQIKVQAHVYQGLKMIVLGSKGAGKTSFVQSLADNQSRLTMDDDVTDMCSVTSIDMVAAHTGIEKYFKLSVWDFSGNPFYLNVIHHFLDGGALYCHVFNLAKYKTADFEKNFAEWLDYVIAKNNQVKVILIGTHADLLQDTTVRKICGEAHHLVQSHFNSFKEKIQRKVKEIESLPNIGAYMQDQLKHYVNTLMGVNVYLYKKILPVSSLKFTGFEKVEHAIKSMASTTKLFPTTLRQIPSLWVAIHDTVEYMAKSTRIPVLHIEEFKKELIAQHGMKQMMDEICCYLHETGHILWFKMDSRLKDFVFLRPCWVIDVIKSVILGNVEAMDFEEMEDLFVPRGITRPKFTTMKDDVKLWACMDNELFKVLVARDAPSTSPKFALLMHIFCAIFEYAYSVEKTAHGDPMFNLNTDFQFIEQNVKRPQSAMPNAQHDNDESNDERAVELLVATLKTPKVGPSRSSDSSQNARSITDAVPCVLIPCLRNTAKPAWIDKVLDEFYSQKFYHLTAVFIFPVYFPPGLFERIAVCLNQSQFELCYEEHWNCGFYAHHKHQKLFFLAEKRQRSPVEGEKVDGVTKTFIRLEICSKEKMDLKSTQELWSVFIPIIMNVEELISKYKGLRVERFVECPSCFTPSFNGEWLAPKDMQIAIDKKCSSCNESIRTELLIQPKEKKAENTQRVFEELKRRRHVRSLAYLQMPDVSGSSRQSLERHSQSVPSVSG